MLTLLTAQLGDGNTDDVITAAEAVEITHLASLYHDDVMDESQMRRGVPSAQTVWGNSVAILTGDLLFARASQLIARLGERALTHADRHLRAARASASCTRRSGRAEDEDPIEHYLQVLADKTGSLIARGRASAWSSRTPTRRTASRSSSSARRSASRSSSSTTSSTCRRDRGHRQGGRHRPARGGRRRCPCCTCAEPAETEPASAELLARIERDVSRSIGRVGDPFDTNTLASRVVPSRDTIDAIVAELRDHEVTRDTLAEAHRWARDAVVALAPLPEGRVKKALTRFADTIVERSS